MKFNEKFRYCRKTFGLTQQEIANHLSVTKRMVAYYESGQREPSLKIINTASKFFCVPVNYFILENETDPGDHFIEASYKYELQKYRDSDFVKDAMQKILAAGGSSISPTDPFWECIADSIARVIMYSEKKSNYRRHDDEEPYN